MSELTTVMIAPWAYVPTEPMMLVAQDTETGEDLERLNFDRVGDAMAHFARFHVGPIIARRVAIVDHKRRVVIAYQAPEENTVVWFGTELGFSLLELFHDRASVVLWAAECHADLNRPVKDIVP